MTKKMSLIIGALAAIAAIAGLGSMTATAQGNTATLTGTVNDAAHAVIPGATITVTDDSSGVIRTTTSDGAGVFSFVGVPVGTYDVKVSATGFNSLLRQGIAVHISDQIELKEITLSVATQTTSVTVTASGAELTPTTSGEVSYTLTDTQLHDLDIEGRSAIELLGLIPGSGNTGNFNGAYNSASAGFTQNSSAFTVNGNRFDLVNLVSDGAPVSDLNTAGSAAVTPNVDMISELKVESAAYSVTDPNGPIVVSTETKSGGRSYHGLAELTARDHVMNANDWQEKEYALPAPQTSLFYPAVQLGGPIGWPGVSRDKDKLFFFAATELSQQHVDLGVRKSTTPAVAGSPGYTGTGMANGDFTDSAYLSSLSDASNGYLNWPVGNQPCSGSFYSATCVSKTYGTGSWGQIASGNIDPAGKILLSAFPAPDVDPATHGGYNLITDYTVAMPRNQETLKLDYAATDNAHASLRFNHENESVPSPYGPWNTWNMTPYPAPQTQKNASNSLDLSLTNVLSSRLTNEATLGWTRFSLLTEVGDLSAVSTSALNYPYANLFPSKNPVLPNVSFEQKLGELYVGGGELPPYLGGQDNYTFNDGLTFLKGTHLFRAGFYAQYARYNLLTTGNDNGSVDTENYDAVTGNDWAELLIGNISNFSQTSANIHGDMALKRFDFYGQDTWKLSSHLTVNYGLRIDHIGWWYDRGGHITIFDPAAYDASSTYTTYSGMETHATTPSVPLSGAKPLGFQYAPGVGFAYSPGSNGGTVVRGGFGSNYYADPGINAFSGIMAPPQFQVISEWAGSTPYTLQGVSQINISSTVPTVWGTAYPKDHLAPVTYSWNAAVSHLFWGANKVEANYVGNSSHNLVGYGIQNAVPFGSEAGPYYGTYYDQQVRPYALYGDISTHFHNLNSNYNAMQLTVNREKGWLNYWGSYTFGKTLAYNAEDAFVMRRWYGPAPFDRSQILSLSYYFKLPAFGDKLSTSSKTAHLALNGWQISGIFQGMMGGPIGNNFGSEYSVNQNTVGIYANSTGSAAYDGITYYTPSNYGAFATGTPDEVAVPSLTCSPTKGLGKNQYFNPTCFAGPTNLSNGAYRLPYIHGPAYINDSIGLFKAFAFSEKRSLEIRGEAFNLFNHPWNEFIPYDPNMYMGFSALGGAPTSTNAAGTIDNKTGHREISLASKFYF